MSQDEKGNLKLIVRNQEDLKVISAYSQDSIVAVKDITFLKKNRIFVMIINRFMWEDIERGINRQSKRIRCALKFEGILNSETLSFINFIILLFGISLQTNISL